MVKGCIRGLTFVLEILPLKKSILSRFVSSSKKMISAKNYKFGKEIKVEDI